MFNRSTRQLHLTEAGEIYHNKVAEILQMIDDAEEAVNELQDKPRGTLNLNVPIAFGRRKVAPLLPKFMAQYPEIEIELTMTDTVINVIEEGADVAIRVGELTDSSLIARKLAPNRRVVAAAPEYLAKHGTPETPDDLRAEHHRFLSYVGSIATISGTSRARMGQNGISKSMRICTPIAVKVCYLQRVRGRYCAAANLSGWFGHPARAAAKYFARLQGQPHRSRHRHLCDLSP